MNNPYLLIVTSSYRASLLVHRILDFWLRFNTSCSWKSIVIVFKFEFWINFVSGVQSSNRFYSNLILEIDNWFLISMKLGKNTWNRWRTVEKQKFWFWSEIVLKLKLSILDIWLSKVKERLRMNSYCCDFVLDRC